RPARNTVDDRLAPASQEHRSGTACWAVTRSEKLTQIAVVKIRHVFGVVTLATLVEAGERALQTFDVAFARAGFDLRRLARELGHHLIDVFELGQSLPTAVAAAPIRIRIQ